MIVKGGGKNISILKIADFGKFGDFHPKKFSPAAQKTPKKIRLRRKIRLMRGYFVQKGPVCGDVCSKTRWMRDQSALYQHFTECVQNTKEGRPKNDFLQTKVLFRSRFGLGWTSR